MLSRNNNDEYTTHSNLDLCIESLAQVTCVQSIQWLNTSDNGEILTSNTGEQQLVVELDDITAAINNTNYTCEVTLTLQSNGDHSSCC